LLTLRRFLLHSSCALRVPLENLARVEVRVPKPGGDLLLRWD